VYPPTFVFLLSSQKAVNQGYPHYTGYQNKNRIYSASSLWDQCIMPRSEQELQSSQISTSC